MAKKYIGASSDGVPRIWGYGLPNAKEAAQDYIARRPDTGPLGSWVFVPDKAGYSELLVDIQRAFILRRVYSDQSTRA